MFSINLSYFQAFLVIYFSHSRRTRMIKNTAITTMKEYILKKYVKVLDFKLRRMTKNKGTTSGIFDRISHGNKCPLPHEWKKILLFSVSLLH
mmetsp:Transcript_18875/g.28705  ORF Transcript_18875/g.28705 Transcript_18875/m.28705 type:complete len:92 (-) Transcript_18875:33-308(-)